MEKKKIILTAVSGNDPYTIKKDRTTQIINYNYGSLLSILKKQKEEGNLINEIYLYLSFEMAVREVIDELFSKSIKSIYREDEVKILYFPENIIENLTKIKDEVLEIINGNLKYEKLDKSDVEKIILPELEKDENKNLENSDLLFIIFNKIAFFGKTQMIGRINVNEFGSFYSDFNDMLNKLKQENKIEDCDIYINISSGTSAMQSDFNLMGITNAEINAKIMQTSTPEGMSNNYTQMVHATDEDLKIVEEFENKIEGERNYRNRVNQRYMQTTKRLILLKSLEDSFEKRDFAGVNCAIEQNSDIVTSEIINYAKNLYYRYIGDDINAKSASENVKFGLELYPLRDLEDENFRKDFENIVEKFNVMKIKAERNEFNDWLLISTPIIEKIIEIILEVNGFKKENYIGKINKKDVISENVFNKSKFKDNDELAKIISKNDGQFFSAYRALEIMKALLNTSNKNEIIKVVRRVDTTRPYRIRAAHSSDFVVQDEFEKNIYKDFNEEFENMIYPYARQIVLEKNPQWDRNYQGNEKKLHKDDLNKETKKLMRNEEFLSNYEKLSVNKKISRVEEVHQDIKELLMYIYEAKSKEINNFENACNIYGLIENRILELLKEKINEYK